MGGWDREKRSNEGGENVTGVLSSPQQKFGLGEPCLGRNRRTKGRLRPQRRFQ